MRESTRFSILHGGTLLAAVGASLCCVLPVAVAFLGVGSAAAGAIFEPYRPYMIALTVGLLGYAFYRAYRPERCPEGKICEVPDARRRERVLLWIVSAAASVLMTFPYYIDWIL